MKNSDCIACGAAGGLRPAWAGLLVCRNCGHGTADLDLESLDFGQIYSRDYFHGAEYVDYPGDRATLDDQFRERLSEVRRYVSSGRLIEIGCAYGFFLKLAEQFFEVTGFDLSADSVAYAKTELELDARAEPFTSASCEAGSAEVIVLWDTIEHLPHPDQVLQAAAQTLKPGGYLFLTTGDLGSFVARLRRRRWRLFHPPTHLHYFTRRSMRRLLESCGLSTVGVRYPGVRRSIRQIAYSLLQLNRSRPSRLYEWISRIRPAEASLRLNTFDIMLVVARKDH